MNNQMKASRSRKMNLSKSGRKTITVREEVYNKLIERGTMKESFSDLLLRLMDESASK